MIRKSFLAPLQPTIKAITTKGEKNALMSYGDCKEEIAKRGDVMAVVVVEENEEHNEPPPIMKPISRSLRMLCPRRYHMGFHP